FEKQDFSNCKCHKFSEEMKEKKDIDFNIILFNDKIITMHDTNWSSIFEILSFTDLISNYTKLVPEWVLFSILVELLQDLRYFIDQMDPIIKNLQTSIVSSQNNQILPLKYNLNRRIFTKNCNPLTHSFKHSKNNLKNNSKNNLKNNSKDEGHEEMILHENFLLTNDLWSLRRTVKPKLVVLNVLNKNSRIKLKSKFFILLNDFHRLEKDIKEERKVLERLQDLLFGIINLKQSKENNDLSKRMKTFTVISLIFLPLQAVSGLWGMNVRVPGEKGESLWWFVLLTMIGPFFTVIYMIIQKIFCSKIRTGNKKFL
ncbi:CorA Metal Ion Transporter (MIT) Family, partial [Pseudoloma neurophilia]